MPDSFGKRKRREVKAKRASAVEDRRAARKERKEAREAGLIPEPTLEPLDGPVVQDFMLDPEPEAADEEPKAGQ
jgi:hypothetical protein